MPPEAGGVATDSPTVKILLYSENPNGLPWRQMVKVFENKICNRLRSSNDVLFFFLEFVLVFSPVIAEVSELFSPAQKIPPPA